MGSIEKKIKIIKKKNGRKSKKKKVTKKNEWDVVVNLRTELLLFDLVDFFKKQKQTKKLKVERQRNGRKNITKKQKNITEQKWIVGDTRNN